MTVDGIDLLLRPDYPAKSGGDLVLAREFETALREAGADAALHPLSVTALGPSPRAAHVFNVDRFFEFVASTAQLAQEGRPFVVSPVHHPMEHVDRFERTRRRGGLKAIATVGRTRYGRERIKHAIRTRSLQGLSEARVGDVRSAVRRGLEGAALVVVQAPSELAQLERTFGARVADRTAWVPNGVTVDPDVDTGGDRDIDVLVAGRIEERKNQLALAQALAATPWRVTFVGGDNARNAGYAADFHRTVAAHANLQHVPHVSLEDLRRLYGRSRLLLSGSRFEVVSLAELEAVAYGCRLVSTTAGYMRDYLGDLAAYMDPTADGERIRTTVETALRAGINADGMAKVRAAYTWERSHRALADAYRSAGLLPA
jgi:glycosyltransferase involved in cell wall biosynthesis